jgi:hypothetical protein
MDWMKRLFRRRKSDKVEKPERLDAKTAEGLCVNLPWHGNDIYLEDSTGQVKAVCSSAEMAKMLAECIDCYSSIRVFNESRTQKYAQLIQDAYYLYVAMTNAKIPVNTVGTVFVEKAFHQFCKSLTEVVKRDNLKFEQVSGMSVEEVNSIREKAKKGDR